MDDHLPVYQTVFYPDINDDDTFVLLHCGERIFDQEDMARGWVSREQLLELFSDLIEETQIGPHSCVVEFELPDDSEEETEGVGDVVTLPVR